VHTWTFRIVGIEFGCYPGDSGHLYEKDEKVYQRLVIKMNTISLSISGNGHEAQRLPIERCTLLRKTHHSSVNIFAVDRS
jgi:hypothetical protein